MKAWRFYSCTYSRSCWTLIPTTWSLIETDKHGPGWAFSWLGFELCFEELVPYRFQLVTWAEHKVRQQDRQYSSPSDKLNEVMKDVDAAADKWVPEINSNTGRTKP